ncbi:S-layer homology domain-containing protein [Salibacterium salarium]|nr:S-layer homology domain-containing protein [Salibacterium salarium]
MKELRYVLSFLVAAVVLAPSVVLADSSDFSDVNEEYWANDEIQYLADEGVISGYENGTFRPNEPVKRSQAASMIVEALDLDTQNRPDPDFRDIDETLPSYDVAATVQDEGIMGGKEGAFLPNDTLTRGQMAAVLERSFDLDEPSGDVTFSDVSEGFVFENEIKTIADEGITTGYDEDNTFRPNNDTTRAQFSVFLSRVLNEEDVSEEEDNVAYPAVNLDLHFLNVGQGDSILIEPNGGGGNILIDANDRGTDNEVVQYLENNNINSLEWVVATHPDADHISGLVEVMEEVDVENVLSSGKKHTTDTYEEYMDTIEEQNINVVEAEEGEYLDTAAAQVQIVNDKEESSDLNESSVALHLTYGETTALFTGDATVEQEAEMIEQYDVEADVLKVGHHGAATSTSEEFVEEVDPDMAVLSYGENNYGHPDVDVVERLRDQGTELYSTDEAGNIEISLSHQRPIAQTEPWDGNGEEGDEVEQEEPESTYPININTAGDETLQEITGVGPAIAENIIDYRETNGSFQSIEEIMNVNGIAEGRFADMKEEITI